MGRRQRLASAAEPSHHCRWTRSGRDRVQTDHQPAHSRRDRRAAQPLRYDRPEPAGHTARRGRLLPDRVTARWNRWVSGNFAPRPSLWTRQAPTQTQQNECWHAKACPPMTAAVCRGCANKIRREKGKKAADKGVHRAGSRCSVRRGKQFPSNRCCRGTGNMLLTCGDLKAITGTTGDAA